MNPQVAVAEQPNHFEGYCPVVPTGYRILVRMSKAPEKTASGLIVKPESVLAKESVATVVAQVVDIGPDAYTNLERFPSGPWCSVGDWVIFRSYAGTRYVLAGVEFRLLNDDSIEAVTTEPEQVAHP